MNENSGKSKHAVIKLVKGIRRKTCGQYTAEEEDRRLAGRLRQKGVSPRVGSWDHGHP